MSSEKPPEGEMPKRVITAIDVEESNFGYGPHTKWPSAVDRIAWHEWYKRENGAYPDCDCLKRDGH